MTRSRYALSYRAVLWAGLGLALLAHVQVIHAQPVPATITVDKSAFQGFMAAVTGNSTTVGIGTGGTLVATSPPTALGGTGGWSYASNFGVGATSSGAVVSGTATIPVGATKVPITGTSKIPAAALGKLVGKFAAKVLPGIAAFGAAAELLTDIGIIMKAGQPGSDNTFGVMDETTGGMKRAYYNGTWYADPLQACKAYIPSSTGYVVRGSTAYCTRNGEETVPVDLRETCPDSSAPGGYRILVEGEKCPGGLLRQIDVDELQRRIARESGWPDPKRLGNIVAEAINSGQPVELEKPVVTGPATVPGSPVTKTTTNPQGQSITTTTNTTNNITYNDNKVTNSPTTVTTTVNNNTGEKKEETETTDDKRDECEKNPDSLACATTDVPDGKIPKSERKLTYSEDSRFSAGGGTCPPDAYARMFGQDMKVWDWTNTCNQIVTYVRPVVLVLAVWIAVAMLVPGKGD